MIPVILSAGEGSRVGEETADLPKWFLQVGDRRICEYQLDALGALFDTAYVALGHGFTDGENSTAVIPSRDDINIKPLVFPNWKQTENAGTAAYALDQMSGTDDLLLICGDVIFSREFISGIVESYKKEPRFDQHSAITAFEGIQNQKTAVRWNNEDIITDYGKVEGHEEAGVFILNEDQIQKGQKLWEQNKNEWFPFIFSHVRSRPIRVTRDNHYEINTTVDLSVARKQLASDKKNAF